jgi:hypothetical protein
MHLKFQIDRNCDVLPLSLDDFFKLYNINVKFVYKQADRCFAIPILEGTNRYKGMVQKIHARGLALMSAHVSKIFTLQIFCSTIFS